MIKQECLEGIARMIPIKKKSFTITCRRINGRGKMISNESWIMSNACGNCKESIGLSFKYCPYCGEKICWRRKTYSRRVGR